MTWESPVKLNPDVEKEVEAMETLFAHNTAPRIWLDKLPVMLAEKFKDVMVFG